MPHSSCSLWLLLVSTSVPCQSVTWFPEPGLQSVGARIPVAASPLVTAARLDPPDSASSLQWLYLGDRRIRFFDDPLGGGREFTPTGSSGSALDLGAFDFDDRASSYDVFDTDPRAGWIRLHENAPTQAPGQRAHRYVAEFTPRSPHSLAALHVADRASALAWSLPPNVVVTVYDHADGTGRELTLTGSGDEDDLGQHRLDDRITGLRWRTVDPTRGSVTFYEDEGFAGPRLERYLSEQTLNWRTGLASAAFDDVASSVTWEVPVGESVLLYDSADGTGKGGAAVVLTGVGQCDDLARWSLNDRISAFELRTGDLMADHADRDRPYDENTHLLAHDAHASVAAGWTEARQELDVTRLLDFGARAVEVDTFASAGDIYLATSVACATPAGPSRTLDELFAEIFAWQLEHPRSLVTVILDHRPDPNGGATLDDHLAASAFRERIATAPAGPWPTPNQLLAAGRQVVVLRRDTSSSRAAALHDAAVENTTTPPASVTPGPGSAPIDGLHRSVLLMNHHPAGIPGQAAPGFFESFHEKGDLLAIARSFGQAPNLLSLTWAHEGASGGPLGAVRELNADWVVRSPNAPKFTTYGRGCSGDLWASTPPSQGTTFSLRVTGALPGDVAVVLLGSSTAAGWPLGAWAGLPCLVEVTPAAAVPTTPAGALDLFIPVSPAWTGIHVFAQGLLLGTPGTRTTRAGYARIG